MRALLVSLVLLTTSTALADEAEDRKAPPVPPWTVGLPEAKVTPEGLLLPGAMASEVHSRLRMLDAYPARCQARLDAAWAVYDARVAAETDCAVARQRAEELSRQVEQAQGWPLWQVLTVSLGAGVAGVVLGVVVGLVAAR